MSEDQIMVREDVAREIVTMTGGATEPESPLTLETLRQAIDTIQDYPVTPSPAMDRWRAETLYGQGAEAMSWPTPDRESSWDQHHLSPVDVWHA